jgi:two-component system sensor histidine kinase/response regulator
MNNNSEQNEFTILLVDDREENLIALEDMLAKEGRIFKKATSGNDALKIILKNADIGLVMLDVQMPGMDGFEVARILKSNPKTRHISIIFVTAISKEEQYVLKGFEEGAVDYLQKPLDVSITRAKVNVFEHLYFYQHKLAKSLVAIEKVNQQLERFLYTVSHDLKSPLAGIAMIVSAMEGELEIISKEELEAKMQLMSKASLHLTNMVDSMLDYSKKSYEQQTRELVNIEELVMDTARLLFPPAAVSIRIKGQLPTIITRKLKLQQVFQNLIGNAIKFNDKKEGIIEIGCSEQLDRYEFYVKDNGPGLKDKDNDQLFSLFRTGNAVSKGESSTGIGLNLLKMIVEEQGGRIWVESEQGTGSTFYFDWHK